VLILGGCDAKAGLAGSGGRSDRGGQLGNLSEGSAGFSARTIIGQGQKAKGGLAAALRTSMRPTYAGITATIRRLPDSTMTIWSPTMK
jgi:hypothetical protein